MCIFFLFVNWSCFSTPIEIGQAWQIWQKGLFYLPMNVTEMTVAPLLVNGFSILMFHLMTDPDLSAGSLQIRPYLFTLLLFGL